ncbi:MAG: lipoate--protein ligase family protein [Gemmatimonadaceae bacterium]
MPWKLLLSPAMSGAENMAVDEALMGRAAECREPVLRVYSWRVPTLSLGRNQTARGHYDLDRARQAGVEIVRRPTGGRAVLHHREVTYSVTAPVDGWGTLGESYGRVNRLVLDGLRRLGIAAALARTVAPSPLPGVAPCFENPVAGEIVAGEGVGERKLVGSAQYRDRDALLQHGSILVEDDQHLATTLLVNPPPPAPPPATLRALLGRIPSVEEVAHALFEAVRATEDPHAAFLELDDGLQRIARRARLTYQDDAWTWRR